MVPDNCVNSVLPHRDVFETPPSRSHRTSKRTFRQPTKAIEIVAYLTALIFLLTLCPHASEACVFNLKGWPHHKTIDERAERADVVVVAKVIAEFGRRRQDAVISSARCVIKEVTKGLDKMKRKFNFPDKSVQVVHGFGSAAKCLPEVKIGRVYLMMLTEKNNQLHTDYMGNVEEYSRQTYNIVRQTLGWYRWTKWSSCSASCGGNGTRTRTRKCREVAVPCSYGTSIETAPCNRWPCQNTVNILKQVPKFADREKRSSEIHGDQIFPRALNDSGFSMFYNITFLSKILRRSRKLIEVSEVDTGAPILSVNVSSSLFQIGFGDELLDLHIDMAMFPNASSKTILIDFNTTHISAYINCKHYIKQIFVGQRWSALTNSNVTVHFYKNLKKIVNFFVITTQHSRPPAECSSDTFEDDVLPRSRWGSWSRCSVSCGIGLQQRQISCDDGSSDCYEPGQTRTETRKCMLLPCPAGRTVAVATSSCTLPCLNNGRCVNNRCVCARGFEGSYCQNAVCNPRCKNKAICLSPNFCACRPGYKGSDCSQPICYKGCRNNGQCIAPNTCACSVGFRGRRCQHAICINGCQNGGKCIYPNVCSCKYGTYGQYCEKFECYPGCMNGGKCVGYKKCKCKRGFYGRYCHRVRCRHLCLNGGSCTRHGICKCPRGFYGPRCSEKYCERKLKYKKVLKPTYLQFYETVVRRCGRRRMKLCRQQRLKSVVANRIIYKPFFTCTTQI